MCETTKKYWCCDCEVNYIHSECETWCYLCGAVRNKHHPGAKVSEVEEGKRFFKHPLIVKTAIRAQADGGEFVGYEDVDTDEAAELFAVQTLYDYGWAAEDIAGFDTRKEAEIFDQGFQAGMRYAAQAARDAAKESAEKALDPAQIDCLCEGIVYDMIRACDSDYAETIDGEFASLFHRCIDATKDYPAAQRLAEACTARLRESGLVWDASGVDENSLPVAETFLEEHSRIPTVPVV